MTGFGVRSAYGSLKRVLMHRPGPELDQVTAENLKEFNFERPVDRAKFVADYDVMLRLFQGHGVETLLLREVLAADDDALAYIDHRPNMTYTRDLAAVFSRGAVLMGPWLKGRWGDQHMMARAFERLGVPILGAIEPPGYLEGGGVTLIGEDTAVASLCDRANQEGTRALREILLGKDVRYFLEVPLPFGHIHIDGIFMVLDEKVCLIHEDTFRVFPCRLHEAGKSEPRHVLFRRVPGSARVHLHSDHRRGAPGRPPQRRGHRALAKGGGLRAGRPHRRGDGPSRLGPRDLPCGRAFQGKRRRPLHDVPAARELTVSLPTGKRPAPEPPWPLPGPREPGSPRRDPTRNTRAGSPPRRCRLRPWCPPPAPPPRPGTRSGARRRGPGFRRRRGSRRTASRSVEPAPPGGRSSPDRPGSARRTPTRTDRGSVRRSRRHPVTPARSPKSTARKPGEGASITESKKPSTWE